MLGVVYHSLCMFELSSITTSWELSPTSTGDNWWSTTMKLKHCQTTLSGRQHHQE